MIPIDPSRENALVRNQLAKPIPLTQSFDNLSTALDDIIKVDAIFLKTDEIQLI